MSMQDLLKEQQQALQHALDLHNAMARKLHSMDSQLELAFEAPLPTLSPSPSPIDPQLTNSNSPAPCDSSSKQATRLQGTMKGLARWSPPKEEARHRGNVESCDRFVKAAERALQSYTSNNAGSPVLVGESTASEEKGTSKEQQLGQPLLEKKVSSLSKRATLRSPSKQPARELSEKEIRDKAVVIIENVTRNFQNERRLVDLAEEHQIDVQDLYHSSGFWYSWMMNDYWNKISFTVILLNTFYIAVDTDYNTAEVLCNASVFFQVVSNAFCGFFFVELFVRLMSLKSILYVYLDTWLVFDLVLVLMLVWENWVQVFLYVVSSGAVGGNSGLSYFSMLRVFRVFRLVRALRMLPELLTLVMGMMLAIRSVLATVLLLGLTIYLFSIVFTQLLSDQHIGEGTFETVPQSMQFLLIQVLCGPDGDFIVKMLEHGAIYYFLWLFFLFLGQLTIMNMLIGVVCNAVDETTEELHDNEFTKEVSKQVSDVITAMDADESGYVSKQEFFSILDDEAAMKVLYGLGVDLAGMAEFFEGIYRGVEELEKQDVLDMVVQFRHSKATTVKDLLVVRRMIHMELGLLEDRMLKVLAKS